jgi:hypothetical protein
MTDNATIWKALQKYLPKKKWIPLAEIFTTVNTKVLLDDEDLERASSYSGTPRWESNVRRLLRMKMRTGSVRAWRKLGCL